VDASSETSVEETVSEGGVESAGPVDSVETHHEERESAGGVEVAEGASVQGGVATHRYGLDEGMVAILAQYGDQVLGVLAKVVGSAVLAVVGLLLIALCSAGPSNAMTRKIGLVAGLAALVGGPVLVWLLI